MWGASTVLLTRIVLESRRTQVFGTNFQLIHVGIGIGSLAGTSIVSRWARCSADSG